MQFRYPLSTADALWHQPKLPRCSDSTIDIRTGGAGEGVDVGGDILRGNCASLSYTLFIVTFDCTHNEHIFLRCSVLLQGADGKE